MVLHIQSYFYQTNKPCSYHSLSLHLEHIERLVSEDPEKFLSLTEVLENLYLFLFHVQFETVVNGDFHHMVTEKK